MRLQVVFLADVPPKYLAGDVRPVKGGYARNYLIPQGLAAPATVDQLKRIEKIKRAAEDRRSRDAADLRGVADRLEGLRITLKGRAGQGGRLYGSITTMAIAAALTEAVGQEIDRRTITLADPIRELGAFEVPVRLHMDLSPTVTVVVEDAAGRYFAAVETAADDDEADEVAAGDDAAEAVVEDADGEDDDEDDA